MIIVVDESKEYPSKTTLKSYEKYLEERKTARNPILDMNSESKMENESNPFRVCETILLN